MDNDDPTAVPRVLSWADATLLGYSEDAIRHRVAMGAWRRILPRTYLTSDTLTWPDRQRAAVTFAGAGALMSGSAALCDLGLPAVHRPDRLLVLAPAGAGPHSTAWVRIRRSSRTMTRELAPGPPRVSYPRAVADLAIELRRIDDVRALVSQVVRRELCTSAELALELHAGPRRGSAFLRQAIDEVDAGAWSAPEARAAGLLRRAGLPAFEQNAPIALPGGGYRYADFLWRELRAILEIDSREHHGLPGDADATSDRHLVLETLGYSVVHRTPRFVYRQPDRFVHEIGAWLVSRASALGLPTRR